MQNIQFDDSQWPIVLVRWHNGWTTNDLHDALASLEKFLRRGWKFAVLVDTRGANTPNAVQRKIIAEFYYGKNWSSLVAMAGVDERLTVRAVWGLMKLLGGMPFPHDCFTSAAKALGWLKERLGTAQR